MKQSDIAQHLALRMHDSAWCYIKINVFLGVLNFELLIEWFLNLLYRYIA